MDAEMEWSLAEKYAKMLGFGVPMDQIDRELGMKGVEDAGVLRVKDKIKQVQLRRQR